MSWLDHVEIKHNHTSLELQMGNKVVECLTTEHMHHAQNGMEPPKKKPKNRNEMECTRWIQDSAPYCQMD